MAKTFYLTTAIDYTNGAPHIGHAYEKVLADVIARYHRLKTDEDGNRQKVYFLTGVDQHGQKVQQSAEKAGMPPQQFVDEITAKFIALWEKLEVKYDGWAATTDPLHKKCVQGILQRLFDEGKIYRDKQAGYYSVRQEQFLTDKERGPDGEFGPEWGQVEHREEENYYFRLAEHKPWLLDYLRSHPDCVTPDFRQKELINAVEKLSGDLCISRPKPRLSWGIELPFDANYVNYVWFDALTNYISFIGYDPNVSNFNSQPSTFQEKWPALHIIGKDILIPAHGIYWPIMLHALGFPDEQMPKFLVHGWWNISGAKMSKSLGNVIDPNALAEEYGAETLRYYLTSDISTGGDSDFSEERLLSLYGTDLANSLGNLLNRSLTMAHKYRDGRLSKAFVSNPLFGQLEGTNPVLAAQLGWVSGMAKVQMDSFVASLSKCEVENMNGRSLHWSGLGNSLVQISSPWALVKDASLASILDAVLYHLLESLRIIAIYCSPVLPKAANGMFDQLNWKSELNGKEERFSLTDAEWGMLPDGHFVGKPVPLFPRIETDKTS